MLYAFIRVIPQQGLLNNCNATAMPSSHTECFENLTTTYTLLQHYYDIPQQLILPTAAAKQHF